MYCPVKIDWDYPSIWHLPWKCKQRFSVSLMLSQRSQEFGHKHTSTECDYISCGMSCPYVLKQTSTLPPLRNGMNCLLRVPNQSLPLYSHWSPQCNGPYNGFWQYRVIYVLQLHYHTMLGLQSQTMRYPFSIYWRQSWNIYCAYMLEANAAKSSLYGNGCEKYKCFVLMMYCLKIDSLN